MLKTLLIAAAIGLGTAHLAASPASAGNRGWGQHHAAPVVIVPRHYTAWLRHFGYRQWALGYRQRPGRFHHRRQRRLVHTTRHHRGDRR